MDSTVNHVSRSTAHLTASRRGRSRRHLDPRGRRCATAARASRPARHCVATTREVRCATSWVADAIASLVVAARGVWTARERASCVASCAASRDGWRSSPTSRRRCSARSTGGLDCWCSPAPARSSWAATAGRVARAGGLGPLIGDEGSAFWLGREWLRLTPRWPASRALARRPDAVARVAAWAPAGAAPAPAAATREPARSPRPARSTWRRSPATSCGRLQLPSPVRVSWSGGVASNAWYRAGLRRALGRRFACRWQAPVTDPALAAARLASRLAARRSRWGQRRSGAAPRS